MKNPLVFFVGAAVAAVTVVAAATVDRWEDWPTRFQTSPASPFRVADDATAPAPEADTAEQIPTEEKLTQPMAEAPAGEPADTPETDDIEQARPDQEPPGDVAKAPPGTPEFDESEPAEDTAQAPAEAPAVEPDEQVAEPERLAAVDPREAEPAPGEPAAPGPDAEAAVQPSFDVVRLEEDGSLIVVGRAAPGAEVALRLDGEVVATGPANDAGEWLIMPDNPLPPGSHELTVEASDASGSTRDSTQVIALAVPERTGERPPIEPSRPPQAEEDAEEPVAAAPEQPREEEPEAAEAEAPPAPGEADEDRVAMAPLPEAETEPKAEPEAPAPRQVEPPVSEGEPDERVAVAPEAQPDAQPGAQPKAGLEQPEERLDVPLTLETVDYNDDGDIVFSGRADPGSIIRIYVDNRFVGETTADRAGRLVFAGREQIAPGRHTLRADLLDGTGNVFARLELPFVRADSREIAALVEGRRKAADEQSAVEAAPEVAEPEAAEPEAAEPAAEPDQEPEAPAVAEEVAPEPEPEAPEAAEEAAPEPEAPKAAEEAAPEPEAPKAAEEAAPEAEPKIAEAAREAEPKVAEAAPESEAPEPAEELAPEPEPEAAEMPAADGEGEAPKVAAVEEKAGAEAVPAGQGHVVIQPGNNLWRISRVIYGRGIEYTVIYQANRDQIRDPDLIYPGQIFATPGVNPPQEIDPDWRRPLSPEELERQSAVE